MVKKTEFVIDGKTYEFNNVEFAKRFKQAISEKNVKVTDYEEDLADELSVSSSTIHNWRLSINGPSTLDIIESIAKAFDITVMDLLKEMDNMKTNSIDDRTYEALKNVHKAILDYIENWALTYGYRYGLDMPFSLSMEVVNQGEYGEREYKRLLRKVADEYLALRGGLYDKIIDYCEFIMVDIEVDNHQTNMLIDEIMDQTGKRLDKEDLAPIIDEGYQSYMSSYKEFVDTLL